MVQSAQTRGCVCLEDPVDGFISSIPLPKNQRRRHTHQKSRSFTPSTTRRHDAPNQSIASSCLFFKLVCSHLHLRKSTFRNFFAYLIFMTSALWNIKISIAHSNESLSKDTIPYHQDLFPPGRPDHLPVSRVKVYITGFFR